MPEFTRWSHGSSPPPFGPGGPSTCPECGWHRRREPTQSWSRAELECPVYAALCINGCAWVCSGIQVKSHTTNNQSIKVYNCTVREWASVGMPRSSDITYHDHTMKLLYIRNSTVSGSHQRFPTHSAASILWSVYTNQWWASHQTPSTVSALHTQHCLRLTSKVPYTHCS